MSALKYIVPLHPGESFRSFASRLGAANGSPAMLDFCRDMAVDLVAMDRGDTSAFARLASLGGVDHETLQESAILHDYPNFVLAGQKVSRGFVARSRLRFCPHCIREDMENGEGPRQSRPWHRSAWSISLVRTCPKHQVLLVTPDIDVPAFFKQDVAVIFQNRKVLDAMVADNEPVPTSLLEEWTDKLLHGRDGGSSFLASLPFHVAVRFTEIVGASVLHGRLFKIAKFTEREWVEAGRAGFEITVAGEDAIREFLGTFERHFRSSRRQFGGKIVFGSLYSWLQLTRDPGVEPLRQLARDYVIDHFPVGPGDEFLGPVQRRRWHSLHSAHKEYGLHPKRVRSLLLDAGMIDPLEARLSDHRAKVDAASGDVLLRQVRDGLLVHQAISYAGMTNSQWNILTEAGYIPSPTERAGTTRRGAYSQADIDALLASVRYSTGRGDPAVMTSISIAVKMAQCSILEIVRMLVNRTVDRVAVSPSRKGFAGVLVDPEEIIALLPPKEKKGLTTAEACKRLGLNEDVVRALMAAGHIPAIPTGRFAHGREVGHIPEKDVESFVARYASLWEVAQSMGSRSRWKTNARLAAAGIRPAFDRATYGSDVYERSKVAGLFRPTC